MKCSCMVLFPEAPSNAVAEQWYSELLYSGVLELHAVGRLTDIPLVSPPWQVVW